MTPSTDEIREQEAEQGVWRGKPVARSCVSPDGFTVLVGRTARDNDTLTFKIGRPADFWFHVAADSGSHVIVRNPAGTARLPRETLRLAAGLAAGYSRLSAGGKVAVHYTRCSDVRKPQGFAPGKVTLRRYESVQVAPRRLDAD